MYHPHSDEMVQMAMGMMGFFVVHPKMPREPTRSTGTSRSCSTSGSLEPGTTTPDPTVMTDFNLFTFNGRVFPGTAPLVVRLGERVRIRLGNLSMTNSHPIHLHGYAFKVTGTDGGPIPEAAQWPETTVNVPVGSTRDIEFVADAEGDWAFHCHKVHHTMNGMGHDLPVMLGVKTDDLDARVRKYFPGYMPMGTSMAEMMEMGRPSNTIGSRVDGPFGDTDAGGMFTVVKVRAGLTGHDDPGWSSTSPGYRGEAGDPVTCGDSCCAMGVLALVVDGAPAASAQRFEHGGSSLASEQLGGSVHRALGCWSCHGGEHAPGGAAKTSCQRCHERAAADFGQGSHGLALRRAIRPCPPACRATVLTA